METCCICLENLFFPTSTCENGHSFHKHCILNWNQTNLDCPICRSRYYPAEKEEYCALRYYKNPTLEEIDKILKINPWQIKHLKKEQYPGDYDELWLKLVSITPSVIKVYPDPPLNLRCLALTLNPETITCFSPTFMEFVYAFHLKPSILQSILPHFPNFENWQQIIFVILVVRENVKNIRFFNLQVGFDYALSINPNSIMLFRTITIATCRLVLKKYKKLVPYCLNRASKQIWKILLHEKYSLIQHYYNVDIDIIMYALKINLKAFFYLNYKHKITLKIIEYVLTKSRGNFIKYIPQNLTNCKIAYSKNANCLKLIKKPSRSALKWINSLSLAV